MSTISVVITTCNEAEYIDTCLISASTIDTCIRYTDLIFNHPKMPVVELARNFGISKASCDIATSSKKATRMEWWG